MKAREELEVIEAADPDGRWDAFVREAEGSSFCHLAGWRPIVEEALGHACHYLVAMSAHGEWEGVLPLVRVRSRLFGDYLVSMPFLNYGGPIGSVGASARLQSEASTLARRLKVGLLELRSRARQPAVGEGLVERARKVTVVLELPEDPAQLWKEGLRAKVRSQIRRPMKEGMTVRFGPDQAGRFYRVLAENMRDLGTPVLPRAFFHQVATRFPGEVEFGCVYLEDRPVAAGCGFLWKGEFEMTWASSLSRFNPMAPNMLLYWAFMERIIGRGGRAFNFGRCTPGGGTHRFKSQWGGRDEPLPWLQWSPRGLIETPNPDRPLFRAATKVWSRLPLPIANRIGPPIARRIP